MLEVAGRYWWLFLVRGLLAIGFGVVALMWPGITLLALVVLFGAYVLVDGIVDVGVALAGRGPGDSALGGGDRMLVGLIRVVGIAAGLIAFFWPGITAFALLLVVAAWAILRGVTELIAAWRLRAELTNEWMWVLTGLLSIALGVVLIVDPGAGALALVFWIGIFAIAWGVALCVVGFRVRSVSHGGAPAAPAVG